MVDIQKHIEAKYDTTEKIAAHTDNTELFSMLHNDIATKNQKEQQFFAYIVTQIESLLNKYPELVVLRDIDETLCRRIKSEEGDYYDVVRKGLYPTLEYLSKKYPGQIEFGILSRRPSDFLQETFIQKTNADRPETITNYFKQDYIFSSRDYADSTCLEIYECKNKSGQLSNGHRNKANAHHDIQTKNPEKFFILIDDCIGFGHNYRAQLDRHIPFPTVLTVREEDAIMQQ